MNNESGLVAYRLFNRPLAIHALQTSTMMADTAGHRSGLAHLVRGIGLGAVLDGSHPPPPRNRPYLVTPDAVAMIPVRGLLMQRWHPWAEDGVTGLNWLRVQLILALDDPAVRAIILDIESFGGEVAGTFDLVDMIYEARGTKPVWAILTEEAYSAAYAIASAADRILIPRTGGAGSIGVIAMVVEMSKALTDAGIMVHLIRHGDHKAEGNPAEPLSDEARARIQAQVDACGELFIATVARNRGRSANAIRALQAGTFLGPESVRLGLADAVCAPDEAYRALVASL